MTRNHDAIISRASSSSAAGSSTTRRENEIEEQYAHYPAETVEQIRNQVSLSGDRRR